MLVDCEADSILHGQFFTLEGLDTNTNWLEARREVFGLKYGKNLRCIRRKRRKPIYRFTDDSLHPPIISTPLNQLHPLPALTPTLSSLRDPIPSDQSLSVSLDPNSDEALYH